jgi:two-component system CheB/CheR fusion protein
MPPRKSKGPRTSGPRRGPAERPPESFVEDASPRPPSAPFPTVGIGASAGGLDAFTEILRALPPDTGMAFVVIQHLDPTHASMLPEILGRATSMPVTEVADQMVVKPNHVYVIPPGVTMAITRGTLQLTPRREVKGQHRPIDHFLRALAEDQGHRAIGVILSGSATDGTLGLEAIKAEGGITFAQDESAQHTSMPNSAIAAGCVDFVLPPAEIAQEIARISRHPYVTRGAEEILSSPGSEPSLSRVLDQLRVATGVDFSSYKRNTLLRRITRRAVLHKMDGLRDYARFLQGDPAETEALYQDVLISVTSFFRNSDAFEILKSKVFPRLVKDRSRHDPVRVWSIGCSTGEEAYSIAIAWAEFSEAARLQIPLQVFATDLNGASIEKARAGIYRRSIVQDVSPERLRRFFFESDGTYRISKAIRDTTVFARHNVLTEPPFSRIDLISCRNLLIYLELSLQQKAMGMMHYALKPGGVLWLGSSETIGSYRDLFDVEDGKYKMYVKKPGPPRLVPRALSTDMPAPRRAEPSAREVGVAGPDVHREADRILLAKYTPPSVLVNADMEILQFRGDTGPYLTPAPGKASLNLLKMLRDGLLVGIRAALHRAKREETPIREDGLQVRSNGGFRQVNVHVVPIRGTTPASPLHFVVLFEDVPGVDAARSPKQKGKARRVGAADRKTRESESIERETARLTQELAATREYLQSVIEQQEAANEELQSSNEEVQSANEELQSINEELETSKEEVQSSNEELATVNEELQNRNIELGQSNNDFMNLLASVQLPIVMLGSDLRIRRFTPMAEKLLNLIATDVGRPISDIKLGIGVPDLEPMLVEVIEAVTIKEVEVRDKQGRWHILRMRPYRTQGSRIDGAVLVLIDIDAIKRDQVTLRRQNALLDQVNEAIFMWQLEGGIVYWNRGAQETYGFTQEQALGRKPYELLATLPPAAAFLEALQRHGQWTGELTHTARDGSRVVVDSRMVMERDPDGSGLVFEVNHSVTERKLLEDNLRAQAGELLAADRAKDEFLAVLAHELRNPLSPLTSALEIVKDPATPPPVVERAWQIMAHQVQNMARLVDDLLDLSRVSQGRIQLRRERVDATAVVGQAIEANRQLIDSRGQELNFSAPETPVVAEVDPLRLEQIVGNLLSNASKFTTHGGHIWVSVDDDSSDGGEIVIRVRDDGIGISATALPRLFDLFMQENSSIDRASGGLGIGLTLVRHLVELHSGRVEARSAGPGQGSEFVVRLPGGGGPLAETSSVAPAGLAEPRPASRRVLVTDDSGDGAEALAILLRLVGHDVQVAHSGPETHELASRFQPEVIFLDIGMPGMDGLETARRLRQMPGFESTLLVALTGYGRESDRQHAFEAGFDDFLVKPPNPVAVRALSLKRRPSAARDQAADS